MTNNRKNVSKTKYVSLSGAPKRADQTKGTKSDKQENQKTKVNKKKTPRKYRIKLVFKLVLLLFLITILFGGIALYMTYGRELLEWQQDARLVVYNSTSATFRQTETSVVYDTNGKQITTLKGEKDVYYIEYEDIPDYAAEAMISIEDKKFETHPGIDLKAIIRALKAFIDNKGEITQGASTITQQLSRNIFLTHEVSWERKIKEIFIALEIEKKYTKEQIMEFYLNNIYFGNGYYGIQAASKGYFSREVTDLSLGEIAFLCAIPNNPTIYDPLENYDNTIQRKNRIINQMYDDGKLTLEEKNDAIYEEIELKTKKNKKQNYIETYIYYCATRALMEDRGFIFRNTFESEEARAEYEEAYDELYTDCQRSLFSGGYRIYTSIDTKIQKQLQDAVDEELKSFTETNDEGTYSLQGSATTIDNETGRVVAIVGGRSQKTSGYTLNRAYQSFRQPGSAIKPLIVYTPAFERGYTPDTIVVDEEFEGGPKNSSRTYSGKITVRTAVETSKNTIAWKLFEELSPTVGLQYLLNMNFTKIDRNDYYPAASLGGFTTGVSSVEMASAFAALENDGIFREPTCIVKIMDTNGQAIVDEQINSWIVYDNNASRMMTDVLEGVLTRGTGKGLGLSNMAAAGKTGTTDDKKDGWFAGYTPYYTTSVWVGYDLPRTLNNLSGASYPGKIWHNFMEELHEGLEYRSFAPYEEREGRMEKDPEEEEKTEEEQMDEEDVIDDEPAVFEEGNEADSAEISGDYEEDMDFETEEEDFILNEETGTDEETLEEDFQEEIEEPQDTLEEYPEGFWEEEEPEENVTEIGPEEVFEDIGEIIPEEMPEGDFWK